MKILTVWQPWASLIILGAKPYEFRGWKPPRSVISQRIGIHAGARPVKVAEVKELLARLLSENSWTTCLKREVAEPILRKAIEQPKSLPLSHILGTAVVGQPRLGDEIAREFGAPINGGFVMNDSGREEHSNWGWPMLDIEPLVPPISTKGKQGLWDFPVPAQKAA